MAFGDTIQSKENNAGSATTLTLTFDATATLGNLLVAIFSRGGVLATFTTVPSGWTEGPQAPNNTSSNITSKVFWKISDGTETSVVGTTAAGAGTWRGVFAEFEGPFAASPLDQSAENEANISSATTSLASGTTGTTSQADELALVFFGAQVASNVDTSRAYSNSFSEVIFGSATVNSGRCMASIAKRILSSTGTYSSTYSCSDTGDEMYGAILTFKKSTGGSPQTINLDVAIISAIGTVFDLVPGAISKLLDVASLLANGRAIDVFYSSIIPLDTASLLSSGQVVDIAPGQVSITLDVAILSAIGEDASIVKGAVTISLDTSVMIANGQTAQIIKGQAIISLDTSILLSSGQAIDFVTGAVTTLLDNAVLIANGNNIGILSSGALSLDTAVITASGRSLDVVPGAFLLQLDTSLLNASGISFTVIEGQRTIVLDVAITTSMGRSIDVVPGTYNVLFDTAIINANGQDAIITAPFPNLLVQLDNAVLQIVSEISIMPGGVIIGIDTATLLSVSPDIAISAFVVLVKAWTLAARSTNMTIDDRNTELTLNERNNRLTLNEDDR